MKKAGNNILKIIAYPLLYLGLQFFISSIYAIIAVLYLGIKTGFEVGVSGGGIPFQNNIMEEFISNSNFILIPLIISGIAAFIIIYSVSNKEWKAEAFWSTKKVTTSLIIQCVVLGVVLNIFTIGILSIMPIQEQSSLDYLIGNNIILQILGMALIGPFIEEIIFRGIVFKRLTKMMRLGGAVILQAVIFGFIHLNIVQGIYAGCLGIIIGLIYLWYDSIWAAVAVHTAFNLTSVLITYFAGNLEIDSAGLLGAAVAALAAAAAITALLISKKPKRDFTVFSNSNNYGNADNSGSFNRWAY